MIIDQVCVKSKTTLYRFILNVVKNLNILTTLF